MVFTPHPEGSSSDEKNSTDQRLIRLILTSSHVSSEFPSRGVFSIWSVRYSAPRSLSVYDLILREATPSASPFIQNVSSTIGMTLRSICSIAIASLERASCAPHAWQQIGLFLGSLEGGWSVVAISLPHKLRISASFLGGWSPGQASGCSSRSLFASA